MEARKVLEMGGGTLLISMPKKWAHNNGLKKGDTVSVEQLSPRKLLVQPIEDVPRVEKELDVGYPKENLAYLINDLTGAYLLGYDVIRIKGDTRISREDRDSLKTTIGRLAGLEIMDEDSKGMTLQFLLEPSSLAPEKLARRMSSIVSGMLRDTKEGVGEGETKTVALVNERDDEVDRLYFLLVRAIRTATIDVSLAERFGLLPVEILDYRVLASFLESAGDAIADFSKKLSTNAMNKEMSKKIQKACQKLEDMGELAMQSFLQRRAKGSRGSYLKIDELRREIEEMSSSIAKTGSLAPETMVEIVSLIGRISRIFVDISDLSLPSYPFG
jgi:phosphate uptake regulator